MGAELFIPLRAKGELVGILAVGSKLSEEAYSQDDQLTMITLSNQMAVAIDNARLYEQAQQEIAERKRAEEALRKAHEELERRVEQLSTMQEIARELNASLDLDRVLNLVLELTTQVISAHAGVIALLDKGRGGLFIAAMQGFPPHAEVYRFQPWPLERGIVGWVARTGQPSLVADVTQDSHYVPISPSTRSQLTVPLLAKGQVIGVIALASSRLAGFGEEDLGYLSSLVDQAAIAINNAQLLAQAEELAIAEERNRIAREMHDGLVQNLAALLLKVQRSQKLIDADPVTAKRELSRVETTLQQDTRELRRLILALRPRDLEELGFPSALHRLIHEFEAEIGITIHLSGVEDDPCLSWELEFVLFRVVQESLRNVQKHAQAKNVWIDLFSPSPSTASLTIRDDGRGFDSAGVMADYQSREHLGLLHMRERVEALGGTLAVETVPTSGTRVAVTLPITTQGGTQDEQD
jgi:signal transduction histidine kinase